MSLDRAGTGAGAARTALSCSDVSLTIDGHEILTDVTLSLAPGELLAVIGPNGAGKTSLINVLSGVTYASGTIKLGDRGVSTWPPHKRARIGLGRTFQTSNLLLGRTVFENVRLAAHAGQSSWRTGHRLVTVGGRTGQRAADALAKVGLAARSSALAAALSHGDRRKLELAIVLAQGADVILLDEPMAGVNAEDVADLVELIRRLHVQEERTIVMVEHHMNVVLDLAQRIAVMHHGRVLAVGSPDEVTANETVQTAYIGQPL